MEYTRGHSAVWVSLLRKNMFKPAISFKIAYFLLRVKPKALKVLTINCKIFDRSFGWKCFLTASPAPSRESSLSQLRDHPSELLDQHSPLRAPRSLDITKYFFLPLPRPICSANMELAITISRSFLFVQTQLVISLLYWLTISRLFVPWWKLLGPKSWGWFQWYP